MTFDEYINNPMGIKNAVYSNRNMYRDLYTQKFNQVMVRENAKLDYLILKDKNAYFIILKIPSEATEDVYYDVCIKVDIKSVTPKMTIKDCPIQFFSNDPYFCYTFAYAFAKRGVFVKELSKRMPKEFLKERAKERNPSNEIGYDKALYFAYLGMQMKGLFSTAKLESECKPYSERALLLAVMDAKDKILERQNSTPIKEKKTRSKDNTVQHVTTQTNYSVRNKFIGTTKTTNTIGKKSGSIKTTKRTSSIGRKR